MSDPKYPVERADLTRLPWRALAVVAKVIESGDRKYRAGDWITAPQRVDGRRDLASALRHIGEYVEGQNVDDDSGESPIAHAAARLLFLLEREARGIKGGGWRIGQPTVSRAAGQDAWRAELEETIEAVGRMELSRPAVPSRFCPAFHDRGGRPFGCVHDHGHAGPHSFTRGPLHSAIEDDEP